MLKETEFTCSAGIAHNKVGTKWFSVFPSFFSEYQHVERHFAEGLDNVFNKLIHLLLADAGQTSKRYEQTCATNCCSLVICERSA